jgi:CDP-2,3-bis-(O-geranylgeranyl)-sn-glycerol synthase
MQIRVVLKLLALLTLANGTPVMAKNILRDHTAHPLDGGLQFIDGRPLFGPSKTIRGVVLSVLVTSAGAPLLGLPWKLGALIAALAMAGDLFSSFLKRRIRLQSGDRATGLDQVPESLFPLLACRNWLSLTASGIAVTVVIFFVGEVLVSRLLHKLHLRDRPY